MGVKLGVVEGDTGSSTATKVWKVDTRCSHDLVLLFVSSVAFTLQMEQSTEFYSLGMACYIYRAIRIF